MIGYEGAQVLDIAGPLEMFAAANVLTERSGARDDLPYSLTFIANQSDPVLTTGGLRLVPDTSLKEFDGEIDTLMVAGGDRTGEAMQDRGLIDFVAEKAQTARRIVSICSGAFLLAEAGLLAGKRDNTLGCR